LNVDPVDAGPEQQQQCDQRKSETGNIDHGSLRRWRPGEV
jgi:hypothetical protein